MPQYKADTELRRILFELDSVAGILKSDLHTLMELIPRNLDDIGQPPRSYQLRYTGQHEEDLKEVATRQGSSPILLLFEEWGTSGRKRPTLNHLYQLLITAELFRAADYIADNFLKIARPVRPSKGPAAEVDTELVLQELLEKDLDRISYPNSSQLQNGMQSLTLENNLNRPSTPKREDIVNFPNEIPPDSILDGRIPSTLSDTKNDSPLPDLSGLLSGPNQASMNRDSMSSSNNESSGSESTVTNGRNSSEHSINRNESISRSERLESISEDQEEGSSNTNRSFDGPALSSLLNGPDQASANDLPNLSFFGQPQPVSSSNLIEFSSTISAELDTPIQFRFAYLQSATANFDSRPFTNRAWNNPNGRLLGSGGFGQVFLGLHLTEDIPVAAIKRLFPSNYKYEEKYNRELDLLTRNQHPNIVRLLGYSNDDQLSLVYEYLPDGTLEDLLRQSNEKRFPVPVARRLNYLLGISRAIKFLHDPAVNIIHRDVTLRNILLHGEIAKLCDFGLIKSISSLTTTGVVGTGPYLAPEALRRTVTPALDIYSFGVVIAEVATGEAVLHAILSQSDEPDLLERVTARDADWEAMVDRKIEPEQLPLWSVVGRQLLELANDCLQERLRRPSAGDVERRIEQMSCVGLP
ncbi:uncharacterized protein LOC129747589 isoform X1 [Uranotaenia lowii]|uniref:uncharacterized protein LOC129747589 isoform X1 n=1 Tax=Uranotaenia lowii TaxID=190385 RepID=UPI0024791A04|nr:uncharacterized protein LOC129747589 isoform X1 [Uranotaenia lowii]